MFGFWLILGFRLFELSDFWALFLVLALFGLVSFFFRLSGFHIFRPLSCRDSRFSRVFVLSHILIAFVLCLLFDFFLFWGCYWVWVLVFSGDETSRFLGLRGFGVLALI